MSFIKVKVDERVLEDIRKHLKKMPDKIPSVISRALNSAADKARTEITRSARDQFKIQLHRIRETIKISRATKARPSVSVITSESRQPITRFKVSPKMPPALGGVKIKRRRRVKTTVKNHQTTWRHAFLTRFKSGHIGLMSRGQGKTRTGAAKLKQHYGPAVPQMLGGKSGAQTIAEAAETRLNSELDRQIDLALKE